MARDTQLFLIDFRKDENPEAPKNRLRRGNRKLKSDVRKWCFATHALCAAMKERGKYDSILQAFENVTGGNASNDVNIFAFVVVRMRLELFIHLIRLLLYSYLGLNLS